MTQAGTYHIASTLVTTLVSSGLSSPTSVAADNAGNVYFADRNNNAIKKWTAANNTVSTVISTGLSLPYGVCLDAAGNIYIADSGNAAIKKFTLSNSIVTTLVATGLNNPCGVAVDADGNVFISDTDNHALKRWSATDTNVVTLVSSGLNRPFGIATDIAGNVFIADFLNNAIKKWTSANSNVTTLATSGLNAPTGVAVDGAGNVYVANVTGQNIRKWTAATGATTTIVSGLVSPNGVAVDGAGNVYFANTGNNTIREMPRAFVDTTTRFESAVGGSYALLVALPSSLNLLTPFAPTSNQPWVTVGATSSGFVIVNFTNNFGNARTANLTVLGLTVPITQAAPAFILATNAASVGAAPGTNSVALVTLPEGAAWTATNNAPWLHLASGYANGVGSTNIVFTFDVNPGAQRIGTLTIGGQIFTVTQAAPPLPEIGVEQPAGANLIDGSATNNFGGGYVGFTNTINTFVITNSGTTNLTGLAITKDGANAGDFIVSVIGSVNLAPNASTTFTVSFAPTVTGNRTAAIHVANSDPDENPFDIALAGFGVAPSNTLSATTRSVSFIAGSDSISLVVVPEIATWTATSNDSWLHLHPANQSGAGSTNIVFTFDANPGTTRVGTLTIAGQTLTITQAALPVPEIGVEQPSGTNLTDGSATNNLGNGYVGFTNTINTFVITNSGTTNLTGLVITKDGVNAGDFIVSAIGSTSLAPNSNTIFTISFTPTANGNRTAAIHIASNDADENPFDIALTGFGIAPSNTLSSTTRSVGFPTGSDSVSLTTFPSIANWTATANAPWLHLNAANSTGAGSTNVTYTFDANPGAIRVGTLTIAGQTLTVTQAALPVPEIGVEQPAGVNLMDGITTTIFGSGYVGFTNTISTFVITNSGTTNLTGLVVTKDGANAGDFIVTQPGSTTLSPNLSTTFNVSFAPSALGNRTAAIHIASNDSDENPFDIALAGTGIAPSNTLSATSHFVNYLAGSSNVALTITPEIASWTATANVAWLQLSAPNQSGTGSTNITYTFSSNTGAQRVGTLTLGGQVLTVTQASLPTPEISVQQPAGIELLDGVASVSFTNGYVGFTNTTRTFTISNAGNATLSGLLVSKSGAHSGDFQLNSAVGSTLDPNNSATFTVIFTPTSTGNRTAAIQIVSNDGDENPFDIALTGFGIAPSNTLSATSNFVSNLAGSSNVTLTVTPEIATWTATANAAWLQITQTNGVGSTNLSYTFSANTSTQRVGTITIGGQVLTITQAALLFTAALGTTNIVEGPAAGSDSIILQLVPNVGSNWIATANSSWLHLSAPNQSGNTSANVIFTFDANTGATRTGTLTIAGQLLVVTQAGTNYLSAVSVTTLASSGLNQPKGVAVDMTGNLYIADTGNSAIKKWTKSNNTITTLVSSGLNQPEAVAVDISGNVYIADTLNHAIKKWTATNSIVSTIVSSGLNRPAGVALDAVGNIYIADTYNSAIKKWSAASNSVTTITSSTLVLPNSVAVDVAGNIYIADVFLQQVQKWTAANQTITTVVASGLNQPSSIAVDGSGNIFIADTLNHAIKKWTATSGTVTTLINSGLNQPKGVTVDESGNLYLADSSNNQIKELPRAFVDATTRTLNTPASTNTIAPVLPTNVNLLPPFTPTGSQPWLTINSAGSGVIAFSVTANTGASRSANLTVLNRTIPITQTLIVTPPQIGYSKMLAGLALTFPANPGQLYQIESAPAVSGPWITNVSLTGPANGVLNYTNPISTVSNRFFRTRTP